MLKVKLLDPRAKAPTVAHPGEDLGYDLYALEDVTISSGGNAKVRTGIAVQQNGVGFIVKDRSSMADRLIYTHAGVIDAGYRGEIKVLLSNESHFDYLMDAGEKFAQMVPVPVMTSDVYVLVMDDLDSSSRGDKGFGSSGK